MNQKATLRVELLEDRSHLNIVGSILRRSVVENEDLPVHHHTVNGRVRETGNVRPESCHPVDDQGGFLFIFKLHYATCCRLVLRLHHTIENKLSEISESCAATVYDGLSLILNMQ